MKPTDVLLFVCLAFMVCSTWAIFAAPPNDQQTRDAVQRELLEQGPLAPFAPRRRSPADSVEQLDALVKELAYANKVKRQGDGVPSALTPVVIVSSLLGSKLQAQLDSYHSGHWYCFTEWREWFTVWVNAEELLPILVNCWYERMSLRFDSTRGRSVNPPGVSMRYLDYGGVDGVTYLDDAHSAGIWIETVYLLQALGWQVGKNLRAAPYDWRFGPETFAAEDWPRLRTLIEETYTLNNNSKGTGRRLTMQPMFPPSPASSAGSPLRGGSAITPSGSPAFNPGGRSSSFILPQQMAGSRYAHGNVRDGDDDTVAAVSLSMGGPYFLGFLNQQTQAWKDKYIHSFSSMDGAFGGSASASSALISTAGWWDAKFSDPVALRALAQSWPSLMWLMPLAEVMGEDYVWVSTKNPPKNYTTADFAQLLADATAVNASLIYRVLQSNKWLRFDAPGVETHCFFGTNVSTPLSNTYSTNAFDSAPVTQYGNGDGVVPEAGLRMLEQWIGKQAQPIYSYPIKGLFHGSSVFNKEVLRMFLEILSSH